MAFGPELEQARWPVEVLEPMPTEVGENDPVDQRRSRLREEHLAAVRQCRHTGSAVDVDADVSLGGQRRCPGVQSHPDPDRAGLERLLPGLGGGDRAGRGREGDEERVALRVDLDAVVCGERFPKDAAVLCESLGVRVRPERVQQARRTLDVREEERDGAARELCAHRGSRVIQHQGPS